jgi:hypothetical protein
MWWCKVKEQNMIENLLALARDRTARPRLERSKQVQTRKGPGDRGPDGLPEIQYLALLPSFTLSHCICDRLEPHRPEVECDCQQMHIRVGKGLERSFFRKPRENLWTFLCQRHNSLSRGLDMWSFGLERRLIRWHSLPTALPAPRFDAFELISCHALYLSPLLTVDHQLFVHP